MLHSKRAESALHLTIFLLSIVVVTACGVGARPDASEAPAALGAANSAAIGASQHSQPWPPPPVSAIQFEQVSLDQGLSQSVVTDIVQDATGFLWFATQDGLNRYDGQELRIYRRDREDPHSLSDNFIQALHVDRTGVLWIGTHAGGLVRYDPASERFIAYRASGEPSANSVSSDNILAIHEDGDGILWLGAAGGGLDRFDPQSGQFSNYRSIPDDETSLGGNVVQAIFEDADGVLWIGTQEGGLSRFDRAAGIFERYRHDPADPASLAHDNVQTIFEDSAGNLWVGTFAGGLNLLDRATGQFAHFRTDPADPRREAGLIDWRRATRRRWPAAPSRCASSTTPTGWTIPIA